MAASTKPGPLNPPMGGCRVPARTNGPLGVFDQGDPSLTTLLGNTPGPLGFNDWANVDLPRYQSLLVQNPGTLCRADGGTPIILGSNNYPATATGATGATNNQGTQITTALLQAADSTNSANYYDGIVTSMNEYAAVYAINTPLRIAHFLSQIGHESGFRIVEEKGNYSAKRMRQTFGCKGGSKNYIESTDECKLGRLRDKLWTEESTYAHNAKNLLSYVYASRYDNGDEASGDGYRYRGRGMMQLTFKSNYSKFTTTHNQKNPNDPRNFVNNPELLASEQKYGIESAFFYWDSRGINAIADSDNVENVTTAVNGGLNGLADRKARLDKIKHALGI